MIEVPNIGTISDSTNREGNANACTQTPQIKEAIKSINFKSAQNVQHIMSEE